MAANLSVEDLLDAYRTMKTIREFEDRVHVEFAKGGIPGFVHLYAGEEASATGVGMQLRDDDRIAIGDQGSKPTPCSWHIGTSSFSMRRSSRL